MDSTYTSVVYSSSAEDILTVSQKGDVEFKSSGVATVTVASDFDETIYDTIEFNVVDVLPSSISSTISSTNSLSEQEIKDGVYVLCTNSTYSINTVFAPANTNITDLTYTSLNANANLFFNLNGNVIRTLSSSSEAVFKIEVRTANDIVNTLQFRIEDEVNGVVPLQKIQVRGNNTIELGIHDTEVVSSATSYIIDFLPSNATYKDYYLESEDSSIATINNKQIIGVGPGTTKVRICSSYYSDIYATLDVVVTDYALQSFNFYVINNYKVFYGKEYDIEFRSVIPLNSTVYGSENPDHYQFISSDENIISFEGTEMFKFKAVGIGKADITIKILNRPSADPTIEANWVTTTHTIAVVEVKEVVDFDYSINWFYDSPDVTHSDIMLYSGIDRELDKAIKLNNLYDIDGNIVDPTGFNTTLRFFFSGKEVTDNIVNGNDTSFSRFQIRIYPFKDDPEFFISKTVSSTPFDPIDGIEIEDKFYEAKDERITINNYTYVYLGSIDINVFDIIDIQLKYSMDYKQKYALESLMPSVMSVSVPSTEDKLSIVAKKGGTTYLKIVPYNPTFGSELSFAFVLQVNVKEVVASRMNLIIRNNGSILTYETFYRDECEIIRIGGNCSDQYGDLEPLIVGDTLAFEAIYDVTPTYQNLQMNTTTPEQVRLNMPYLTLAKQGRAYVRVFDTKSGLICRLDIVCTNRINFKDKAFDIEKTALNDDDVSYSEEDERYNLLRGHSYKMKLNFTEDSTYKEARYVSSDTDVLTIGTDGTIAAKNIGVCRVSATVYDGITKAQMIQTTVKVTAEGIITSLNDFIINIRKGIGHFGAFFCLGICSSLFLYLFFDNRRKLFAFVAVGNFALGFLISFITELIQVFVPGRAGLLSDVMLDFSGFSISVGIITFVFLVIYVCLYIKEKKKQEDMQYSLENIDDFDDGAWFDDSK